MKWKTQTTCLACSLSLHPFIWQAHHPNIDCCKSNKVSTATPPHPFLQCLLPSRIVSKGRKHEIRVKEAALGFQALLSFSFYAQVPLPWTPCNMGSCHSLFTYFIQEEMELITVGGPGAFPAWWSVSRPSSQQCLHRHMPTEEQQQHGWSFIPYHDVWGCRSVSLMTFHTLNCS